MVFVKYGSLRCCESQSQLKYSNKLDIVVVVSGKGSGLGGKDQFKRQYR